MSGRTNRVVASGVDGRARATRPSGLRRVLWRAVLLASIALVILGYATSQGWQELPPDKASDPENSRALAATMLTTEDLETITGHRMTLLRDWLPDTPMMTRTSAWVADLRRMVIEQAWGRMWIDPGTRESVFIVMIAYRSEEARQDIPGACSPEASWDIPGTATAGQISDDDWYGEGCFRAEVGRVTLWAHAGSVGAESLERTRTLLTEIAAQQLARIPQTPDVPEPLGFTLARAQMLRGWMLALLVISLIAVSRGLLTDRSTWQTLLASRRPGPLPAGGVDVTGVARYRRSRLQALAVARFAALVWALRLGEILHRDFGGTIALVAAAFVLGIVVQRLLTEGSLRGVPLSSRRWPVAICLATGFVLSLAIVAGAAWLWLFGNSMGAVGGTAGVPDWVGQRVGLLGQFLAAWVLLLAIAPLTLARRIAMRLAVDHPPEYQDSVLLLRNFSDDFLELRVRQVGRASLVDQVLMRRRSRFEEIEAFALSRTGSVLAVGRPGERLPPGLGASRLYFGADWQVRVEELMASSKAIVLNLGRSDALVWETKQLERLGVLHKTLFVMPPVDTAEQRQRLAVLAHQYRIPWHLLEPGLSQRHVLAVALPLFGRWPTVIMSATQDDVSYDIALREGVAAIESGSSATALGVAEPADAPGRTVAPSDAFAVPPLEVLPPAEAKRRRRYWQNPWFWVATSNLLVLPIVFPMLSGDPVGQRSSRVTINLNPGHQVGTVLGGTAEETYVVVDGDAVARVNFEDEGIEAVGTLPRAGTRYQLDDGVLYWVAPATQSDPAEVGAWSIEGARPVWSQPLPDGVAGLAVDDARVYVTSASEDTITSLDRQSGTAQRKATLSCQPWDISALAGSLWVSCPATDHVLQLNPGSLAVEEEVPSFRGVTAIVEHDGEMLASSPLARAAATVGTGAHLYYHSVAEPVLDARGPVLAMEGYERVSIFEDGKVDRRLLMSRPTSVAVLPSGEVVIATQDQLHLIQ